MQYWDCRINLEGAVHFIMDLHCAGILYSCIHSPNKGDCMEQGLKFNSSTVM